MPSRPASYRTAGVDIDAADAAKNRIAARVAATHGVEVLRNVGLFGGFFRAPVSDGNVVLVASADSVGTKVLLASLMKDHVGIGKDLVNHCINDVLACGAQPLFFLDYYATPKLDTAALEQVVDGMASACEKAGCALIGGETAQLPGIYQEDAYDLAGFIVGQVSENRIVDGSHVRADDVVIGLPSDGLHTNGFTLARAALGVDGDDRVARERLRTVPAWSDTTLADELLVPHRSYLKDVRPLLDQGLVPGAAHITGGGIRGNLSRVIPDGLTAVVDVSTWKPPPIFSEIQQSGKIADAEMYSVFNMGIGFVLVTRPENESAVLGNIHGARTVGVVKQSTGSQRVLLAGLENGENRS